MTGPGQTLLDTLEAMAGRTAWAPRIGVGSFLTLELGDGRRDPSGHLHGQFHLWVYGGGWEIRHGGRAVADSDDARQEMVAGADLLADRALVGAELGHGLDLVLRFSGGPELAVSATGDPGMEDWLLYLDDGTVISAVGGEVVHEPATEPGLPPP